MQPRLFGLLLAAVLPLTAVGPPPAAAAPPGLRGGSVVRDANGIAHIRAANEHDLLYLQGWVHASDRLFQMDTSRRQASGTLAELLGQPALPTDVEARTIGLRRAAERSLPVLSTELRRGLDAYAAGVNAWVARHPLPAQYAAVRITRFAPWTPVDSIVLLKAIAFNLSFDLDLELTVAADAYARAGAEAGFDGAALFRDDLFRSAPFDASATVPDATRPKAPYLSDTALRLARDYQRRAERTPLLAEAADRTFTLGSNEWAVAGRHTRSGRPIMANDPHLGLTTPATFYPVGLRGGGLDVQGESFAGAPFVILGQNRRVAWGATTNPMDVTDTFVERLVPDAGSPSGLATVYQGRPEPVLAIPETFRVNTRSADSTDSLVVVPPGGAVPAATLVVPRRDNGPIVSLDQASGTALSVQYTGFSATRELDAARQFNYARDIGDFRRALDFFDVGSQNWSVTDVDGHIGYFTSAEMPLREDLEAGAVRGRPPYLLRDGTGGNEWLPATRRHRGQALPYEILPPGEMPHTVDPPAGFFVNANNDPAGTTLDNDPLNERRPTGGIYYLNVGYDGGFRSGRITAMLRAALASGRKLTVRDVQDQQADVTLLDAQFFRPHLVHAMRRAAASDTPELAALAADRRLTEAVGRLARWDCTTPTGIVEGYDAADVAGHRRPPGADEVADSVAATIYAVWRGQYVKNVVDARLAPYGLPQPSGPEALKALRVLLEGFPSRHGVGASGVDFYAVPGVADPADRRDLLLLRSLGDALDLLAGPSFAAAFAGSSRQGDYRWGRLHRVTFSAPLGAPWSVPPAGGAFPPPLADLPGVPVDGGFGTVDAASHNVRADSAAEFTFGGGPVRRAVAQPSRGGIEAVSSLPGGTSETLGSRYYVNLLPRWLTNETYPVEFGPR
jgi:penicillin amidase